MPQYEISGGVRTSNAGRNTLALLVIALLILLLAAHPFYARLVTLALFFISLVIARGALDSWTTVSYYGAQQAGVAAGAWRDPIFGNALSFYLFELPFY